MGIPGVAGGIVGVRFSSSKMISGIRVSRKGSGSCCDDRIGGTYELSYSEHHSATYNTPDASWCSAGSFIRSSFGFLYYQFSQPLRATAIRIKVTDNGACIDELEVYEAPTTATPTTGATPTTAAPTTAAPTPAPTPAPTTATPTTGAPTTATPTTGAPTTATPTAAPTTAAPTPAPTPAPTTACAAVTLMSVSGLS